MCKYKNLDSAIFCISHLEIHPLHSPYCTIILKESASLNIQPLIFTFKKHYLKQIHRLNFNLNVFHPTSTWFAVSSTYCCWSFPIAPYFPPKIGDPSSCTRYTETGLPSPHPREVVWRMPPGLPGATGGSGCCGLSGARTWWIRGVPALKCQRYLI